VLGGLKAMYRNCVARGGGTLPLRDALGIRTLREWDERIVAPRHGFRNAEHYWASTNAGSVVHGINTPTVGVWTEQDPMVPARFVRPALKPNPMLHEVWLASGGHVGFPPAAASYGRSVEAYALDKLLELT
jgi:hypothetical protein